MLNKIAEPKIFSMTVHGLDADDRKFLASIVALFTEPVNAPLLPLLKAGKLVLQYGPGNGDLYWQDASAEHKATVPELLNFIARFDKQQFEALRLNNNFNQAFARRELGEADEIAAHIIGYEVPPQPVKPVHTG